MFDYIEITDDEFKALVQNIAKKEAKLLRKMFPGYQFQLSFKNMVTMLNKQYFSFLESEFTHDRKTYLELSANASENENRASDFLRHAAKVWGFNYNHYFQFLTYFQWRSSTRLHIVEECLARSDNLIRGQVIQQTTQTFLRELQAIHAQIDRFLPVWLPDFDVEPLPA